MFRTTSRFRPHPEPDGLNPEPDAPLRIRLASIHNMLADVLDLMH